MRQLIIDTATEALSVALFDRGEVRSHHHEIVGRGHAEKLVPIIAGMDDGGRAEEIWVDGGPGSFTGIRVGIAAARALAYAWDAAIFHYSSLSLVAAMARRGQGADGPPGATLAVTMTGGHGELFWQMFDSRTLEPRTQPASTPIDELAQQLDATTLFGTGAEALVSARGHGEAVPIHPDARFAPLIPRDLLRDGATAFYGRGADARPLADRSGPQ